MRLSRAFGRTRREAPPDADTPGHRLLLRAGRYTLLPLGLRVQRKIAGIARQELDAVEGAP